MDQQTLQQLRGASDLVTEGVDATAAAIGEAHQAMAQRQYAVLTRIESLVGDVTALEQVQRMITAGVYRTIRAVNRITGKVATRVWDHLEVK